MKFLLATLALAAAATGCSDADVASSGTARYRVVFKPSAIIPDLEIR